MLIAALPIHPLRPPLAAMIRREGKALMMGTDGAREKHTTSLLRVIEALVERRRRIGERLHGCRTAAQHVGSALQAIDRTFGARLAACVRAIGPIGAIAVIPRPLAEQPRLAPLGAQLGKIAYRLLECWPVLFLLGVEPQSRLQPCN